MIRRPGRTLLCIVKCRRRDQWVHPAFGANAFLTRSREEREDVWIPSPKNLAQTKVRKGHIVFFFAFFAASREENLLLKFAHFGECTRCTRDQIH